MSRLRKHLSFANVMAAFAVFIALGGSAYAIGRNTVGTAQLKNNAVTTKKVKNNAVTAPKIRNNAVTTAKIRNNAVTTAKTRDNAVTTAKISDNAVTTAKISDNAVTGAKVDESSLGKVPSATTADTATSAASADKLVGQQNFFVKLAEGQDALLATNGQVSLRATCVANDGGQDRVRILAETTADGAILAGEDDWTGGPLPADFLNVATLAADREFLSTSGATGVVDVDQEIDVGFVMGPDGKAIVANTEGVILGLNYLGSRCFVAGVLNFVNAP